MDMRSVWTLDDCKVLESQHLHNWFADLEHLALNLLRQAVQQNMAGKDIPRSLRGQLTRSWARAY